MKTLFIDCSMGAAGDMLSAALLELMPDPAAAFERLNSFGIPHVAYSLERTSRCGIVATRLVVKVDGVEEHAHEHHHEEHAHERHGHDHAHAHSHRSLDDILRLVDSLALPSNAKADVSAAYRLLADAESKAHGRPVGEVHFHEVGALDAVADIAAACWLMSELAPDEVVASPVNFGGGTVKCAHGTLPVPAPATAALLVGIPSYGDAELKTELCTPTGAALVRTFAKRFGPQPEMRISSVGYGAGAKDFHGRANLLRCAIGESEGGNGHGEAIEIACNIDDMTGEDIAFACEMAFKAGALDVATLPATMKKGRPGVILLALCDPSRRDAVAAAIFKHTTTLGIRERRCRRTVLPRHIEEITLDDGSVVRCKAAEHPDGTARSKLEHDDLAAIARRTGRSLADVRALCNQ